MEQKKFEKLMHGADMVPNSDKFNYAKKLWSQIIERKMFTFSTGLSFTNFAQTNGTLSYDLLWGMGYIGGMTWGWWTTIALLQYYIDPRWISWPSAPEFSSFDGYGKSILHRRIDADASNVAKAASTGLMSVLLPNGLSSFRIKFDKTRRILESNQNRDAIEALKMIESTANELLEAELTRPCKSLYMKISSMMADYMNYGTCMGFLDYEEGKKAELVYIPFTQGGLATTGEDHCQVGVWVQPKPLFNMKLKGQQHDACGSGTAQGFINHFYVTGDVIGEDENNYYEMHDITNYTGSATTFDPKEIHKVQRYKDYSPLMVARMNDEGAIYGIGAGLLALNSIILLNYYTNCSKFGAMSAFYPCIAFSGDTEIHTNNDTVGNTISQDFTEEVNTMPGSRITINRNPGVHTTGMPPITILSKAQEQMTIFDAAAQKCALSIQSTYLLTLLDRLSTSMQNRDVTAEEVRRQDSRDAQRFKAIIEPFYNNIIYPLVEATADIIMNEVYGIRGSEIARVLETDNEFLKRNSFTIELYNFEKKQTQSERLQNMLLYAQFKQQTGSQPSQPAADFMDRELEEMMS